MLIYATNLLQVLSQYTENSVRDRKFCRKARSRSIMSLKPITPVGEIPANIFKIILSSRKSNFGRKARMKLVQLTAPSHATALNSHWNMPAAHCKVQSLAWISPCKPVLSTFTESAIRNLDGERNTASRWSQILGLRVCLTRALSDSYCQIGLHS